MFPICPRDTPAVLRKSKKGRTTSSKRDLRLVRTLPQERSAVTLVTHDGLQSEKSTLMGFLKKFFRNVFRDGAAPAGTSSFERLSEEELEAHLGVVRYGDFMLTDAVRPSYDLQVVPAPRLSPRHLSRRREPLQRARADGRRLAASGCSKSSWTCSTRWAAGRRGAGNQPQPRTAAAHLDLYREHIDMPVLKSILWDYEDLLVNDGCTGIAVLNPGVPQEVQFDEHKLLIVYGDELEATRGSSTSAASAATTR